MNGTDIISPLSKTDDSHCTVCHQRSYPQLGSFRFFGLFFNIHFRVFDIDNAYLVVKKLGSFWQLTIDDCRLTIEKSQQKNVESAGPTAGISGSLTRKGIRDDLSRQVGFVWVRFGFFCHILTHI
jgi:hypothetical protein